MYRSGPPETWQDHQISRAGGPMVHCLEMLISSPVKFQKVASTHLPQYPHTAYLMTQYPHTSYLMTQYPDKSYIMTGQ